MFPHCFGQDFNLGGRGEQERQYKKGNIGKKGAHETQYMKGKYQISQEIHSTMTR